MRTPASPLLPLLRSRAQGDLLALLYLHPERDYSLTEAAGLIGVSVKPVHAEASRPVTAGLVSDSRHGNNASSGRSASRPGTRVVPRSWFAAHQAISSDGLLCRREVIPC